MEIRYLSNNKNKIKEVKSVLEKEKDINIIAVEEKIEELQTEDVEKLAKDKLLKAFKIVGRPMFVEHTSLHIECLNDFPGGLTQIFWDKVKVDKIIDIVNKSKCYNAVAKSIIAYCDGRKIYIFTGEVTGKISSKARGSEEFQWDCIFVPDGYDKTFAELGEKKNEISMRKIALDRFYEFLKGKDNGRINSSDKK